MDENKGRTKSTASDNAEPQSAQSCRRGTPHPGVLQKSVQAVENKRQEPQKRAQDRKKCAQAIEGARVTN
jgi:hypothetical protein